jgi:hypothetical protein
LSLSRPMLVATPATVTNTRKAPLLPPPGDDLRRNDNNKVYDTLNGGDSNQEFKEDRAAAEEDAARAGGGRYDPEIPRLAQKLLRILKKKDGEDHGRAAGGDDGDDPEAPDTVVRDALMLGSYYYSAAAEADVDQGKQVKCFMTIGVKFCLCVGI